MTYSEEIRPTDALTNNEAEMVFDAIREYINDKMGYSVDSLEFSFNVNYTLDTSDEEPDLLEAVYNGPDFNREGN